MTRPGRFKPWLMVLFLFSFQIINFADKVVIGIAAVPIMHDLGISPSQFGRLVSAFFLLVPIVAVVSGFIANLFPVKWVLALLVLVWAFAVLPMYMEVSFTTFLICRIVLGAGEAPAAALAQHAVYKWFEDKSRVVPATLVGAFGGTCGVLVGAPVLAWVVHSYGWHSAFGLLGIVGFVWVALWMTFGEEGPVKDIVVPGGNRADGGLLPYARLMLSGTYIGVMRTGFGVYWPFALITTWVRAFLNKGLGYAPQQAAWIVSLNSLCTLGTALCVRRLVAAKTEARLVEPGRAVAELPIIAPVVVGLALLAMTQTTGALQIACLIVGFGTCSSNFMPGFAMVGEITPTRQRAAALATLSAGWGLAGLIAPDCHGLRGGVGRNAAGGLYERLPGRCRSCGFFKLARHADY